MSTIRDYRADSDLDPITVQAFRNKIFVRILPISMIKNGLLIVASKEAWESKSPIKAEVLSVGPETDLVRKGQVVLIKPEAGRWIGDGDLDSISYRMIEPDDALALVEHS